MRLNQLVLIETKRYGLSIERNKSSKIRENLRA